MSRVHPILASAKMPWSGQISSLEVNRMMMELRGMPYQYTRTWQTPAEVNFAQAGDCKGKALALYAQMRQNGAKNVRVVIGKHHLGDSGTHAWLEWQTKEGSYVLDPTFYDMPTSKEQFGTMTYVPMFAYDGEHKYRATNVDAVAPSANVAVQTRADSFAQPRHVDLASAPSFSSTTEFSGLTTHHVPANGPSLHSQGSTSAANPKHVTVAHRKSTATGRHLATHRHHAHHLRKATANAGGHSPAQDLSSSQSESYVIRTAAMRPPPAL